MKDFHHESASRLERALAPYSQTKRFGLSSCDPLANLCSTCRLRRSQQPRFCRAYWPTPQHSTPHKVSVSVVSSALHIAGLTVISNARTNGMPEEPGAQDKRVWASAIGRLFRSVDLPLGIGNMSLEVLQCKGKTTCATFNVFVVFPKARPSARAFYEHATHVLRVQVGALSLVAILWDVAVVLLDPWMAGVGLCTPVIPLSIMVSTCVGTHMGHALFYLPVRVQAPENCRTKGAVAILEM